MIYPGKEGRHKSMRFELFHLYEFQEDVKLVSK